MCETCFGYGMYALGDRVPMGETHAYDGMPTTLCPECGANANPSPVIERKAKDVVQVAAETDDLAAAFHFLMLYVNECLDAKNDGRSPTPAIHYIAQAQKNWQQTDTFQKEDFYTLAMLWQEHRHRLGGYDDYHDHEH